MLDHLADRQPFSEYAHRLFALAEIGELTVCLSSLSFSNLYYILRNPRRIVHVENRCSRNEWHCKEYGLCCFV